MSQNLRFCPECNEVASLSGIYDREDTGHEVAVWTCPNDHTWEQPTNAMIVRMIGWGHFWRQRRDEINDLY